MCHGQLELISQPQGLMLRFNICLILCGIVLAPVLANANQLTIPPQQIQWRNPKGEVYSPFEKRGYYHKAILQLQVPSNLKGDYYIGIKLDNNESKRQAVNPANNQTLTYFITHQTNTNSYILDWPLISSQENIVPLQFSGGNTPIQRVPVYIWVDIGQSVQPGTFFSDLGINIYKGSFNISNLSDPVVTGVIPLTIEVSNQIEVSLGNKTFSQMTDFNVKFEQLKEGATVKYDAFINAFGNYKLMIKSKGIGKLTHEIQEVKTAIPYTIYLDGRQIQLDGYGNYEVNIEQGPNASQSKHEIKLVLGDASHAFKGDYGDKLSIQALAD